MATVTTASITDVLSYPAQPPIARDGSSGSTRGYLYCLVQTAAGTLTLYRSINVGTSWTSLGSFTHTSLAEWSSIIVDKNGWGHLAYRVSTGSTDTIWYRRVDLNTGVFTGGLQTSDNDANGGVAGATWQGLDLAVVRHYNGTYAIAVAAARTQGTTRYGVQVMGVSISYDGNPYLNNPIITGSREFWTAGTAPGRTSVACELEHNGDGFTSGTPNLWLSWGRTVLRVTKLAWKGTFVGWQGPSSFNVLRTGLASHDYLPGRWDGSRWMTAVINPDDSTTVAVYQRNQANTGHTVIVTPTHTTGVIRQIALSYDATDRDLRVYAVGTSTTVLYFVDYTRLTGTWGSWTSVTATAVLGTGGVEFGVRRGGSSGDARHHVITAHSGAPNTIVNTVQTSGSTPNIATWDTSAVPYSNGGAADVAATLVLDWTFTDPDAGDTQGWWALSRQIGAAAIQYYTAAGGTWGGTEVQNAGATTSTTLAVAWGLNADANHVYKVKVWDAAGNVAADYSAPLTIVPSAKVNPVITAPTAAQVLTTDTVTGTWTAGEQRQRRVRLLTNPGAVQVFDSGFETDTALTYTPDYHMPNGTGWTIELTTTNLEGLASTAQTKNFTVSYAAPPAAIPSIVSTPLAGTLTVTSTALAAVGTQPSTVSQDLWRRPKTTPDLNTNPSMAGDVVGYTGVGTTTMVYSTTQFRDAPGAAFATPTGAAALSLVRYTALTDIVAGSLYYASGWIRPTTANKPVLINLDWYTSGSVFLSSTTVSVPAAAVAWLFLEVYADPVTVSTAAKVTASAGESGTPAAGDTFYVDRLELRVYNQSVGIRVAAGIAAGAVVVDWGVEGITDHEYRYVTVGSNGTSITGAWTA